MTYPASASRTIRLIMMAAALLLGLGAGTEDAQAHGQIFIGGGHPHHYQHYYPNHYYSTYYSYPYYAYPPYPYYAPTQQIVYITTPPYPVPSPAQEDLYYNTPEGQYCREYQRTVTINGQPQNAYGHACQEPDGNWRIID